MKSIILQLDNNIKVTQLHTITIKINEFKINKSTKRMIEENISRFVMINVLSVTNMLTRNKTIN